MSLPQILIVDDEESVRFILERTLRQEGYAIETASSGREALQKLAAKNYDLLLLDLYMEPVGGLQVLKEVRQNNEEIVVIILTAHGSLESAVEALRLGAFDYLFKPAEPVSIRQCVKSGLQRRRQSQRRQRLLQQIDTLRQTLNELDGEGELTGTASSGDRFLTSGPLVIDRHHRAATLGEKLLDLTTTEFNLLLCLVENTPEPLPPRDLLNCALGYDSEEFEAKETIKWHIHKLRRKVEPNPSRPRYIKTVRYKGYMWRD